MVGCDLYFNNPDVTCFLHINSSHAGANATKYRKGVMVLILAFRMTSVIQFIHLSKQPPD